MFQTYAQIENGNVVAYPVDPHIEDQFGELNLPPFWLGGEFEGKTYVFCHNKSVDGYNHFFHNLVEESPQLDQESGLWYRSYRIEQASDEEKEVRKQEQILGLQNHVQAMLQFLESKAVYIASRGTEEIAQWDAYRQHLLTIPDQPGYPFEVRFEACPEINDRPTIGVTKL